MPAALDPLSQIAIRYGADKWGLHLYTPLYHKYFAHWRDKALRLLEIGVGGYAWENQGGASLRMWADYFPQAHIVGVDLFRKTIDLPEQVTFCQGSQVDPVFLNRVWDAYGPFDIVIDDASHRASETVTTFEILFPRMFPGAVYVVEDLHCAFGLHYGGCRDGTGSMIERLQNLVRDMHDRELAQVYSDHPKSAFGALISGMHVHLNLALIERGVNTYPSIFAYDLDHPEAKEVQDRLQALPQMDRSEGAVLIEAAILAGGGRLGDALSVCRAGLEAFPNSLSLLHVSQAYAAANGEHVERAIWLERMSTIDPDDLAIRCLCIEALLRQERFLDYVMAVEALPVVPTLTVLDRLETAGTPPLTAGLEGIRALLRLRIGEFNTALDHVRYAMHLEPQRDIWRRIVAAAALRTAYVDLDSL